MQKFCKGGAGGGGGELGVSASGGALEDNVHIKQNLGHLAK